MSPSSGYPGARFDNAFDLGRSIGILWTDKTSWMNRRVDVVEFCDAITLRFQVSIDMIIPDSAVNPLVRDGGLQIGVMGLHRTPAKLLPIALIDKNKTSIAFTLTDEEGCLISRISARQTEELGAIYLEIIAGGVLKEKGFRISNKRAFRVLLRRLCRIHPAGKLDEDPWSTLMDARDWGMKSHARDALINDEDFLLWARILSEQQFLCILLEGRPGQSRIISFSFETDTTSSPRISASQRSAGLLGARLGLKDTRYFIPASAAGHCASYHCEVAHPVDIEVKRIDLVKGFLEPRGLSYIDARSGVNELRSHLIAIGDREPFDKFHVMVSFRVKWAGWLKVAALLGYGIFLLMAICGVLFDTSGNGGGQGTTADAGTLVGALLLGTGAACITVLFRVNEHQLTARLLRFFRFVTAFLVTLAFGVVLALGFADGTLLRTVFFAVGVAALLGAVVLTLPWVPGAFERLRNALRSFWNA